MAAGDLALLMTISAKDNASAIIAALAMNIGRLGGSGVTGAAVIAGVAIAGIGVASIKAAGDFQAGMTKLVTGANEAKSSIQMVSDGILKMAVDTGTSTKDLSDAMYMVESAGYHGADGLKVLTAATQAAKVGGADLTTVAKALTSVLKDYGASSDKATQYASGLVAVTASGKVKMQDLAASLGNVLPIASALGIKFPEVGAAIATLTSAGLPAQRASMDLAFAIRALAAPTAAGTKALKEIGLTVDDVNNTLRNKGLVPTLQLIEDHLNAKFPAGSAASISALKAISGGAAGLNAVLDLTGKHMGDLVANVASVEKAMNNGKDAVQGWADVQATFNQQLSRVTAAFQVLLIVIGEKLLPLATPVVKMFADMLSGLISIIQGVSKNEAAILALKIAFGALGTVMALLIASQIPNMILGVLNLAVKLAQMAAAAVASAATTATSFGTMASMMTASIGTALGAVVAAIGPIVLLVGGIVLLALGFKHVYDTCQPVHDAVNAVAKAFEALLGIISGALKAAFDAVAGAIGKITEVLQPLIKWLQTSKEGANLVSAAMIGLGAAMVAVALPAIATFIAAIPAIVAGFVAWAASALAAAAATLLAAAPFVAIALIVTLAVFAILEVITHWTEIAKVLTEAWGKVADFFKTTMDKIKTNLDEGNKSYDDFAKKADSTRKDVDKSFDDMVGNMFKNLGTNLAAGNKSYDDFGAKLIGSINNTRQSVDTSFDNMGKWFVDHNYYIQTVAILWDAESKKLSKSLATNFAAGNKSYDDFGKNIVATTSMIKNTLDKGFDDMMGHITSTMKTNLDAGNKAYDDFGTQLVSSSSSTKTSVDKNFDDMMGGITDTLNKNFTASNQEWDQFGQSIVQKTQQIIGAVGGLFAGLWNDHVGPALQAFKDKVGQIWDSMVTAAQKFGENLIKAIAQGVGNAASSLGTAVHDAISSALQAAGFHDIPGFASGVENFRGGWAVVGEQGPELMFLPSGSSVIPSGSPPAVTSQTSSNGSDSNANANMMTIYNVLDGKIISKVVTKYQEGQLRLQGGIRNI